MKEKPSMYYHLKQFNTIIGVTPKVASTSMSKIIQHKPVLSRSDVLQMRDTVKVVIWIRNPYDRFASAYHKFKKNRTVSEFLEFAEGTYNRHWESQYLWHSHENVFLPTVVFNFDHVITTWKIITETELPFLNQSKKKSWQEIREGLTKLEQRRVYDMPGFDLDLSQYRHSI